MEGIRGNRRNESRPHGAGRLGRWIGTILSLAFFVVVIAHLSELERLVRVARQGLWYFVLPAAGMEGLFLANRAALYARISDLTQHPLKTRDLLLPVVAADFLEVAAPTPIGNVPGAALIVREAEQHGMSRTEAVLMNVIYLVLDYTAFLSVVGTGLLFLFLFHRLKPYEVVASCCLAVVVVASVLLLLSAVLHPAAASEWMAHVGRKLLDGWSRLRHRPRLPDEVIETFATNLKASMELLRQGGRKLIPPLLHAFANPALNLLTLYLLFLAFRSPIPIGVLVAGYALGTLFLIVAITPSGLGPVEGMMILTYSSLGVPPETATLVTLVYRGITFWLPLVVGFFAFHRVE